MLLSSWSQVPFMPLQAHTTSDVVMSCAAQGTQRCLGCPYRRLGMNSDSHTAVDSVPQWLPQWVPLGSVQSWCHSQEFLRRRLQSQARKGECTVP